MINNNNKKKKNFEWKKKEWNLFVEEKKKKIMETYEYFEENWNSIRNKFIILFLLLLRFILSNIEYPKMELRYKKSECWKDDLPTSNLELYFIQKLAL